MSLGCAQALHSYEAPSLRNLMYSILLHDTPRPWGSLPCYNIGAMISQGDPSAVRAHHAALAHNWILRCTLHLRLTKSLSRGAIYACVVKNEPHNLVVAGSVDSSSREGSSRTKHRLFDVI